jgi:hypothetical protein
MAWKRQGLPLAFRRSSLCGGEGPRLSHHRVHASWLRPSTGTPIGRHSFSFRISKKLKLQKLTMQTNLLGKRILVVRGSLLAHRELERALRQRGAKVIIVANLISAFAVLDRDRFDAAVIDKGLHNQALELCEELQALGVPYLTSDSPHDLQPEIKREAAAKSVVSALDAKLCAADLQQFPAGYTEGFGQAAPRFPSVKGEGSMAAFSIER